MFISNTDKERKEMLAAAGVSSFEELVRQIPAEVLHPKFDLPPALTEPELSDHVHELAAKNLPLVTFAGGGAYDHFIPSAVKQLVSRGEFVTAYTPYQAEASQGMLQAIYEYQSAMCALLEMEVSNASLYDGATALAEAVNASMRITSKNRVLVPQALNPAYKKVLETYFRPRPEIKIEEVPCTGGTLDLKALESMLAGSACFVLASPNYFGCLEDVDAVSALVKASGALLVALVYPSSLGLLRTPGSYGADFAVAEGQCLGNTMSYGGPHLGVFTCKKQYMRQMPGRLCGMTKDLDGKRAFVLTLQAREQHIRREKASSNICSNEALCALTAAVYTSLLGPEGMREMAQLCADRAAYAAEKIAALPGFKLRFAAPFFNEFAVDCPIPAKKLVAKLAKREGILAGISLAAFGKGFENTLLVCVTEKRTEAEIERLAAALGRLAK